MKCRVLTKAVAIGLTAALVFSGGGIGTLMDYQLQLTRKVIRL